MELVKLLEIAQKNNASDVHISSGMPPMIRVDGDLRQLQLDVFTANNTFALINACMTDKQKAIYADQKDIDFAFELGTGMRFRVNAFFQQKGPAAAFRILPKTTLTLEQLNAPNVIKDIAKSEKGLVLITGPTGSGKSTTLAAVLHYLNLNVNKHIITIEDPIEYIHESINCLIHQRELHQHTLSIHQALRAALREDPDILLIGEMRDLETIRLALTAAETGHLVFATLHTYSATKSIHRIIDVFPEQEKALIRAMLSESLNAVISQTLLKKTGGGRIAIHEVMRNTSAISHLIRENKVSQIYSCIQTGMSLGMQTFEQAREKLSCNAIIQN